jgi:hypothetical protein
MRSGCLLLSLMLAGCAVESTELLFVKPGEYDYLDCAEIAKLTTAAAARDHELQTLTERAEKEPIGAFVAATAYRSDQLRAQGQLKLLGEAARNKNCPPPSAAPAPPAETKPPSQRR